MPTFKTGCMNLRQFMKYWLWRDTTHQGEFAALRRLMIANFPRIVSSLAEKFELLRKMYLALLFRKIRLYLRRLRVNKSVSA
jgi:hypothetical protein